MNYQQDNAGNTLFPVFFKLHQLDILVVGGGYVGLEKLEAILKNSPATRVTLVGDANSATGYLSPGRRIPPCESD